MENKDKKAILKKYKEDQKKNIIDSMPFDVIFLNELFDYIDLKLDSACDHTFKYTKEFIKEKGVEEKSAIQWLNSNGAFCDCEIFNIEDLL